MSTFGLFCTLRQAGRHPLSNICFKYSAGSRICNGKLSGPILAASNRCFSSVDSPMYAYGPSKVGTHFTSQVRVGVIGAPIEKGQMKTGVNEGPQVIRESGIQRNMLELGIDYKDYGNLSVVSVEHDTKSFAAHHPRTFAANNLALAAQVENILARDNRIPLMLGGDHSLAAGSILGHARYHPDLCVIWVDAHADINSPIASRSGNLHGMPLAFLVKEIQEEIPWMDELADFVPCLSAQNLVYIGLRDIDSYESYLLDKYRIPNYNMHDIDKKGMNNVIAEALQRINPRFVKPIHLSFDIDALDPQFARSTGTAVSAGLSLRDALYLCEEIHNTGCLAAMDLVEVNPQLGNLKDARRTAQAAVDIILSAFGRKRSGFRPRFVESPRSLGILSRAEGYANIKKHNNPRPQEIN